MSIITIKILLIIYIIITTIILAKRMHNNRVSKYAIAVLLFITSQVFYPSTVLLIIDTLLIISLYFLTEKTTKEEQRDIFNKTRNDIQDNRIVKLSEEKGTEKSIAKKILLSGLAKHIYIMIGLIIVSCIGLLTYSYVEADRILTDIEQQQKQQEES